MRETKCDNCLNTFNDERKSPTSKHSFCSLSCREDFNARLVISNFYNNTKKNGECMEWQGHVVKSGYGQVKIKGKNFRAHRVSYEISVGEIGDKHVLHKCDNRRCVNPSHLFLGTNNDNIEDKCKKRRTKSKLTYEDVLFIRNSGKSSYELSKIFDAHDSTIRSARRGDTFMHVPYDIQSPADDKEKV